MPYTLTAGTGVVPCEPGRTVLEAFLRNGNWMPNSCNQGTCGTCKIKVLDGELDHRNSPEETLTPDELADGFVLACQATPRGDVVFETPATEESAGTHVLRDVVATVTEVRDIAADTRKVLLTADEPLEFSAGQYVEVTVPGTEIRRQYSLANPPSEAKQFELHIRRQPGGIASEWVFERIDVGERVAVTGPYGDFTFDPEGTGPIVLLGGGTGLAPLEAIVRQALSLAPDRQILLYHGVRTCADLYDADFLRELETRHPGFRYVTCVSRESGGDREGYVTDAFLEDVASAKEFTGYICGSDAFVEASVKAFKRRRMSPRRIRRERFTPAG
ncbi:2Fe-2S iron-sulfur cluster-binding protein [Rhodococcus pyridinivorans]|uniref:2Fe-2S iron-sulfur cluster-binding protein n=1 Tax=Rhodococcus pyridinivorans TaxID=103816 RepID=UPI00228405B8|nr:2Fe-2S iron-sulfur cluster-binding protein [Rhodococcus pyridinivorans]WAL46255.1 FAD-binding oxidoreductase [Rhodococcus pyridinivorans]